MATPMRRPAQTGNSRIGQPPPWAMGGQMYLKPASKPRDYIGEGQESLEGAVRGYGEILRPEFAQMIGSTLGDLNSIGALRSGATVQALDDIGTDYANRVGAFAATTAAQGADIGLRTRELDIAEKARRDRARASLLSSLGSVLGAAVGFVAGGPPGAAVGSQIGGSITNNGGGLA